MTIGLIGYGRFGKLVARFLSRHAHVLVYDRRKIRGGFPSARIMTASLSVVASQPVVLLAVPISHLESILHSIAPLVAQKALVIDVCSVKVKPVQWMKGILPTTTSILGAHPLFGPDTVSHTLRGHRVVLCPARIPSGMLASITRRIRASGLNTEVMTPAAHDRMIAETLLLTQYIGRLVGHAGVRRWHRSTRTYESLRWLAEVAEHDSIALFQDMFRFNPYARQLLHSLDQARLRVKKELGR